MAQAQGSQLELAYVAESTYGITPVTPSTQLVEIVNVTLDQNTDRLSDPSLHPDRMTTFSRAGNGSAEGELEVVLAPDNYDVFLEAALQGTWATNVLKVGNNVRSFAFEKRFTDLSLYQVFNGVVVTKLSIDIGTDELVKAKFGLMGATATALTGTSIDATPTAFAVKDKFYHDGGTFKEGGSTVGYITAISWTLDNGGTANKTLGATGVRSITTPTSKVTGKVTGLFESADLYNKFINGTESSLEHTLVVGAESLTFKFSRVVYTKATTNLNSGGTVTVELEFEALKDATDASTLVVTRV